MRKLLLASAAMLGATSGLAFAQTAANPGNPIQGQYVAPRVGGPAANNNNNSWGVANTASGDAAASPITRIYPPNNVAVPTPGNIVVRLNGRIQADIGAYFTSADKFAGAKLNPVMISSYMRLYPGFDGMAANGLRYGASIELRQNFNNAGATGNTPAGNGSANTSTQTVFVRRSFVYAASDQFGLVRLGTGDGVQGLFDPCIFTSACWDGGVGNFNGGTEQALMPGAAGGIPFVWLSQAGAEYGTNKIVYLSPQFFGFDFGIDYAPNVGNGNQISGATCNAANANCINVSSGGDLSRWINKYVVGARYQGTFGGVDLKAYADYTTAGKMGGTPLNTSAANWRYDKLSFINSGVAVSAMGFTLAADYVHGAVNGQLGMKPSGAPDMNAIVTGLTYVNGPLTLGAEYAQIDHQGDVRLTGRSQRHEWEVAFGGTYAVAPGMSVTAAYMYMQRHQGGFNWNANALGAAGNDTRGQSILLSTALTW